MAAAAPLWEAVGLSLVLVALRLAAVAPNRDRVERPLTARSIPSATPIAHPAS
jgi:hypothetical protein